MIFSYLSHLRWWGGGMLPLGSLRTISMAFSLPCWKALPFAFRLVSRALEGLTLPLWPPEPWKASPFPFGLQSLGRPHLHLPLGLQSLGRPHPSPSTWPPEPWNASPFTFHLASRALECLTLHPPLGLQSFGMPHPSPST
jgi:hypothetical protein